MSIAHLASVDIPDNPGRGRPSNEYKAELEHFAEQLRDKNAKLEFDMSARGWAYALENAGVITKDRFDYAEKTINKCRKKGHLPVDFTARDDGRLFKHTPSGGAPDTDDYIKNSLDRILSARGIDPAFWESQDYFIQLLVEKVDLRELFAPLCEDYNIPIATSKGWSSINQKAAIAGRAHKWARRGKTPVLLYCGDFDPVGQLISDKLRDNLADLENAKIPVPGENEYVTGWTPDRDDLIIDRFGLNHDFIAENDLPWIDNLETSSGKDLASPAHADHEKEHVQQWLDEHGARKVEANALVTNPDAGRQLFRQKIHEYLGENPHEVWEHERSTRRKRIKSRLSELGIAQPLEDVVENLGGEQ